MTLKYKCSLCNRIYNSKRSIYQHFDDSPRHFDEDDDDFESYLELVYDCSKCGREFKSYSNLEHVSYRLEMPVTYNSLTYCCAASDGSSADNDRVSSLR